MSNRAVLGRVFLILIGVVWATLAGSQPAGADVFNMGPGLTSLETVPVGNPGNAPDMRYNLDPYYGGRPEGYGAVSYEYRISKFELTAGQYCAFLNAVASTDTYGLYSTTMDYDESSIYWGCNIKRSGSPGSYSYSVAADWANRPVNCVTFGDAARFCNWLTNSRPTGAQGLTTTEDGSYYLNGATQWAELGLVVRKATARYVMPNEDEWYKAAYYDPAKPGGAGYWDYPTRSDTAPSNVLTDPDPGNSASFHLHPTDTIGPPYYRTEVGEFENSPSPWGTFDQGGNVCEWNEARTGDGAARWMRGGDILFGANRLRASFRNSACSETTAAGCIGIRVAEVPEPGSVCALAAATLLMLRRRSRAMNR